MKNLKIALGRYVSGKNLKSTCFLVIVFKEPGTFNQGSNAVRSRKSRRRKIPLIVENKQDFCYKVVSPTIVQLMMKSFMNVSLYTSRTINQKGKWPKEKTGKN